MSENTGDDYARRFSVGQAILNRVIHTTDNLDEKVGRIFSSMSFLTVGATILFTSFLSDGLLYKVDGVELVPLLFLAFALSVAVATAFMLQAMGPRFHLNPWGPDHRVTSHVSPSPTGYADKIASMREDEWMNYFKDTPLDDLYERWYSESLHEAYALSKKVDKKVKEMRSAQRAFLLSIVFLVIMLILAVSLIV